MKAELKPEELRKGNWMFSLTKNMPFKIWASTIVQVEKGEANALQPIPLNEEWLLKFGFEPNGVFKSMRLALDPLYEYGTRTFIVVAVDGKAWIELISKNVHKQYREMQSMGFKCEYVHQLQNLFYSLTGNELIFNHG